MGEARPITAGRRAFLGWAVAGAAFAFALPSVADTNPGLVGLEIVDRATGAELQIWRHHGRAYVAGVPGARYGLRITNRTGGRLLLVLTVDGINVVTGETARYDQHGYVLNPYQTCDVNGWRKSDAEVAAFTFAASSQSYAARTGRPGDVGVIGMAVFTERLAPPPLYAAPTARRSERERFGAAPPPLGLPMPPAPMAAPALPIPPVPKPIPEAAAPPRAASARSAGGAEAFDAQPREEKLGTAHGEREWSYAARTAFERATPYPQSTCQIEYDTYAHLAQQGVIPATSWPPHRPRPFPLEPDSTGFVPDPPEAR